MIYIHNIIAILNNTVLYCPALRMIRLAVASRILVYQLSKILPIVPAAFAAAGPVIVGAVLRNGLQDCGVNQVGCMVLPAVLKKNPNSVDTGSENTPIALPVSFANACTAAASCPTLQ